MKIEEVFRAINQMRNDAVIERYAVGGAVGATFYLEPVSTLDVDIFIEPHRARPRLGGEHGVRGRRPVDCIGRVATRPSDREIASQHIVISGWPVQFVPPTSLLAKEALNEATEMDVEGISVRVFTAEHLATLALQTGRAKDKARLLQFIEDGALDTTKFESMIERHQMTEKWQQFQRQFLTE